MILAHQMVSGVTPREEKKKRGGEKNSKKLWNLEDDEE